MLRCAGQRCGRNTVRSVHAFYLEHLVREPLCECLPMDGDYDPGCTHRLACVAAPASWALASLFTRLNGFVMGALIALSASRIRRVSFALILDHTS